MKKKVLLLLTAVAAIALSTSFVCSINLFKKKSKKVTNMTQQTTSTGLIYEILQEGTGKSPLKGQKVSVHYTGWLDENGEKGKKFDSSHDRGTPFQFIVGIGQVIAGWDEGVAGMKVGEKRLLIIPAKLGYGSRSVGGVIPANATLIFEVDLLNIVG
jgi:FKBP-type peptidyl-prolyl cis-trans isomerase